MGGLLAESSAREGGILNKKVGRVFGVVAKAMFRGAQVRGLRMESAPKMGCVGWTLWRRPFLDSSSVRMRLLSACCSVLLWAL